MAYPKVKISDNLGKTVGVTENNELKVKLSDSVTVTATDLSVALDASGDSVECIQDTPGDLNATVTQVSLARSITGTVEVVQDTPGDLTATVTQASSNRTVTGSVEITSGSTVASYPQFDIDTSVNDLGDLIGTDTTTAKEIIIQCGFTNTGYIVVGDSAVVAAEGVDSMDGIRLEAGDTLILAATHTANIHLRGSANDQLVNVMIIT